MAHIKFHKQQKLSKLYCHISLKLFQQQKKLCLPLLKHGVENGVVLVKGRDLVIQGLGVHGGATALLVQGGGLPPLRPWRPPGPWCSPSPWSGAPSGPAGSRTPWRSGGTPPFRLQKA